MRLPAQADLQRWSDEVARDPRSLAFLPLARAYRKQGLSDAAMQLCLRGLDAYPSHVEAHALLAMLYAERGEREKAADEWSFVLRLDRDNFDALRGLGFCFLEEDRLSKARQMLERASLLRPEDPAVNEALRLLGTRQELTERGVGSRPTMPAESSWSDQGRATAAAVEPPEHDRPAGRAAEPDVAEPAGEEDHAAAAGAAGAGRAEPEAAPSTFAPRWALATPEPEEPVSAKPAGQAAEREVDPWDSTPRDTDRDAGPTVTRGTSALSDPADLFDELLATGPVLAALLVDARGLVLAGRITDGEGDAALLGAVLGGVTGEAARTVAHLSLGEWRGVLMEAGDALLHLAPAGNEAVIVLAARHNTPAGWMRRAAAQAADRAQPFLEAYR